MATLSLFPRHVVPFSEVVPLPRLKPKRYDLSTVPFVVTIQNDHVRFLPVEFDTKYMKHFRDTARQVLTSKRKFKRRPTLGSLCNRLRKGIKDQKAVDQRTCFLWQEHLFLGKKGMTFGLRSVKADECHVVQVGPKPLRFYKRSTLSDETGLFSLNDVYHCQVATLAPNVSYKIPPSTTYLVVCFDRAYFALHRVRLEESFPDWIEDLPEFSGRRQTSPLPVGERVPRRESPPIQSVEITQSPDQPEKPVEQLEIPVEQLNIPVAQLNIPVAQPEIPVTQLDILVTQSSVTQLQFPVAQSTVTQLQFPVAQSSVPQPEFPVPQPEIQNECQASGSSKPKFAPNLIERIKRMKQRTPPLKHWKKAWCHSGSDPTPLDLTSPEPSSQSDPTPLDLTSPEPARQSDPTPLDLTSPEPAGESDPTPLDLTTPEPAGQSDPTPLDLTASEPAGQSDPTPVDPLRGEWFNPSWLAESLSTTFHSSIVQQTVVPGAWGTESLPGGNELPPDFAQPPTPLMVQRQETYSYLSMQSPCYCAPPTPAAPQSAAPVFITPAVPQSVAPLFVSPAVPQSVAPQFATPDPTVPQSVVPLFITPDLTFWNTLG